MTDSDSAVRRLRIDADLLARLGPQSSREQWERTLRRCGLLDLGAVGGPVGDQIREIQRLMASWPLAAAEDANLGRGAPRDGMVRVSTGMTLAYLVTISLGVIWSCAAGDIYGVLFTVVVVAVVSFLRARLGVQAKVDGDDGRQAARMTARIRDLLSRSFVAAIGETVVENTPHLEWLEVREEQLEDVARLSEGRIEQIQETIAQIQATNRRLGREEDDAETNGLRRILAERVVALERVHRLRKDIQARRAALTTRIDTLRAIADRDALSERVARIAQGDASAQRVVAEIDVDMVEVEQAFAALALDAEDAVRRRTAVLEVVGATRALSRS